MSFDQFLQKRIFDPLGMRDTAFYVPDGKLSRLATVYQPAAGGIKAAAAPATMRGSKVYFSGGGGLFSTAEDYHKRKGRAPRLQAVEEHRSVPAAGAVRFARSSS